MLDPTDSRAVLVTGGSRGIGAAVARAFAAIGDRVAVHYGSSTRLAEEVADSLAGTGHAVVRADLGDPDAVREMVDTAAERLGGIDVLVNNAGVFERHPITDTTYAEWQDAWQRTLAVNLIGAANVTWCAVRHMIHGRGGRIVNVASRGAFRGEPSSPAYGATKAGIIAFGQSLAGRSVHMTLPSPRSRRGSSIPTWPRMHSPAMAGRGGEPRARSGESPLPRRSPLRSFSSPLSAATMASGSVLDLNGASYLRDEDVGAGRFVTPAIKNRLAIVKRIGSFPRRTATA